MKKLIIFIPTFNEENSLEKTINSIPKKINNIHEISLALVDDCSSDKTIEIAKKLNLDFIISHDQHYGLTSMFNTMVDFFKKSDSNLMCVLDADNQYKATDIQKLIDTHVNHNSDLVVGTRDIKNNPNMSRSKKFFQIAGSKFINLIIREKIEDVTTGFRLYTKNCFEDYFYLENDFSYTIETLILFSWKKLKISSTNIDVNEEILRPSRLFKSNFHFIIEQSKIIIDSFNKFYPYKFFSIISFLLLIPGLLISIRFLYFFLIGESGHIQSLILSAILLISTVIIFSIGILSISISKIRINLEKNSQKNTKKYKVIAN